MPETQVSVLSGARAVPLHGGLAIPSPCYASAMDISLSSRIRRVDSQFVDSELDGELVFMNVQDGEVFGLREAALRAWKLIDEDGDWTLVEGVVASLCEEFEVDAATCLKDLAVLLDDLSSVGLAEVAP